MQRVLSVIIGLWLLLWPGLSWGAYGEIQPDGSFFEAIWHLNDNSDPESDSGSGGYDLAYSGSPSFVNTGNFGGGYNIDSSNKFSNSSSYFNNTASTGTVSFGSRVYGTGEADRSHSSGA